MSRTVVLLYPRAEPDWPDPSKLLGLPLAVLTVARPLVAAGYDVRIVDQNVTPRVLDELRAMPRPLFVGISVIGGHVITSGKKLALQVAKLWPGVPRVWGGWNPTLMGHLYTAQSAARWVDIVVRGRGEDAVLALARRLQSDEDPSGIPGVSWRDREGVLQDGGLADLDDPVGRGPLPYDLISDLRPYITGGGVLNYMSSYGCPHRCEFCGIPAYTRTFRALPSREVAAELSVAQGRGVREILFLDDNFFTSKDRVLELGACLEEQADGLAWHSNGRLDQVLALQTEELVDLARSGCRSVNIGYETGDQDVADGVSKDVQVDDVFEVARRFKEAGIHLSLNFMIGLPGETPETLVSSLEKLKEIFALQPDMDVCWYMCMPAPGTELWRKMSASGQLTEPTTLAEHEQLQSLYLEHPWYYEDPPHSVLRQDRSDLKAIAWYFYMGYGAGPPRNPVLRAFFHLVRKWCRWRFEARRFRRTLDWRVAFQLRRVAVRLNWARAALRRTRPLHDFARWRAGRKGTLGKAFLPVSGVHRGT